MLTVEGIIVNFDKSSRGRIEIADDGLITSVGPETGRADLVFNNELVFPGFIDIHVHARECADHSQDYKEDFAAAGLAAINGGVVAFADMPNNPVPPVDGKSYADKYGLAKKCPVDVLLYAGIGPKTTLFHLPFRGVLPTRNPLNIDISTDKGSLRSSSAFAKASADKSDALVVGRDGSLNVPYKVFMGKSVGELFFESFDELDRALGNYKGQSVSFHCEDPEILSANKNQPTHGQQRPPEAEISAIDFALKVIEKHQLKGKICHCSTAEGLRKILAAKKAGLPVTVEVTPHHLYFDQSMINEQNRKLFLVNPPIRQTPENRLALIASLKNGEIDYLATDHAPHTIAEKEQGISGLPHLDTYGPFAAWLMKEHKFEPSDIVRVCSYNPGNFICKFTTQKYGRIQEGYTGSLTVMDMKKPVKIEKSMLKTKSGWSPFEGVEFPGSVVSTIVRGKVFSH